jgi:hypothetical protein
VGPQTGNIGSPSLDKDARLSSRLPGVDVVGARDSSWSCLHFIWLYLAAKPSHLGSDMDGLACSLHRPMVCGWLTWVQSFLTGAALSHRTALGGGTFLEGANPPPPGAGYLPWCCPSGYVRGRLLRGEACFYQGVLIQCQSYHDDYACSFGGVAMSGSDGMDFST